MNDVLRYLYTEKYCKTCKYYYKISFLEKSVFGIVGSICNDKSLLKKTKQTVYLYLHKKTFISSPDPYPQELCHERCTNLSRSRKAL